MLVLSLLSFSSSSLFSFFFYLYFLSHELLHHSAIPGGTRNTVTTFPRFNLNFYGSFITDTLVQIAVKALKSFCRSRPTDVIVAWYLTVKETVQLHSRSAKSPWSYEDYENIWVRISFEFRILLIALATPIADRNEWPNNRVQQFVAFFLNSSDTISVDRHYWEVIDSSFDYNLRYT